MHLSTSLTAALICAPGLALLCCKTSSTFQNGLTEKEKRKVFYDNCFNVTFLRPWAARLTTSVTQVNKIKKASWCSMSEIMASEKKIWLCLKYDLTPSPTAAGACWWGDKQGGSSRPGAQQGIWERMSYEHGHVHKLYNLLKQAKSCQSRLTWATCLKCSWGNLQPQEFIRVGPSKMMVMVSDHLRLPHDWCSLDQKAANTADSWYPIG